ncbi:MAG: glycosyltransferase family 2 protein [Microcoleus sp.]
MSEQHPYRPTIPPVPDDVPRPLWSVMIPTYNCASYLRQTLASVLAQDPGSDVMQIAVVDDHSTQDDPAAVVEELGRGRVEFYRQPHNVGIVKNFKTTLELSRGKLIHQLHGDDLVRDGFYQKMQTAFIKNPEIGAAFCRHIIMDEHSHWQHISVLEQQESGVLPNSWLELIAGFQRIQTPSIVVRREVYEKLGGFDHRLTMSEDWEMWVRIAANYPIGYEVEPLAMYRKHSNSISNINNKNGKHFQQIRKAVNIFQAYLPKEKADTIYQKTMQNCAFHALEIADSILAEGDMRSTINLIREALKCSRSFRVVRSAGRIILLNGTVWLWQRGRTAVDSRSSKTIEATGALTNSDGCKE